MPEDFQDTYGDIANVYTLGGRVFVGFIENPGTKYQRESELCFTPEAAKAFAKAIKRAAKH